MPTLTKTGIPYTRFDLRRPDKDAGPTTDREVVMRVIIVGGGIGGLTTALSFTPAASSATSTSRRKRYGNSGWA